jgi:hypothetical protein
MLTGADPAAAVHAVIPGSTTDAQWRAPVDAQHHEGSAAALRDLRGRDRRLRDVHGARRLPAATNIVAQRARPRHRPDRHAPPLRADQPAHRARQLTPGPVGDANRSRNTRTQPRPSGTRSRPRGAHAPRAAVPALHNGVVLTPDNGVVHTPVDPDGRVGSPVDCLRRVSATVGRTASRSTCVSLPLARGLGSASGRRPAFRATSTTGSPQGGNQR